MTTPSMGDSRWARFRAALGRGGEAIRSDRGTFSLGAALLALAGFYRLSLFVKLGQQAPGPLGFQLQAPLPGNSLRFFFWDVLVVAVVCLGYWAVKRYFSYRLAGADRAGGRMGALAGIACEAGILVVLGTMFLAHYRLLFELGAGLTLSMIRFARGQMGVGDLARMANPADALFLVVPLAVYALARLAHHRLRPLFQPALAGVTCLAAGLWFIPDRGLASQVADDPVQHFVKDLLRAPLQLYFGAPGQYVDNLDLPGEAQMRSIALVDGAFVTTPGPPGEPDWRPGAAAREPWNVLFFVLESTGADYVFDTAAGNPVPMPFLQRMTSNGVWLANHFSTCNSSPRAGYSIFTGLYPRPDQDTTFEVFPQVSVPMINRYLGLTSNLFLVHPSSLTFCFPLGMFYNSGFRDFQDRSSLPRGSPADVTDQARHELVSVQVLLDKLDAAKEPFFGVYWSFVPHFPYSDYGPDYRIRPNLEDRRDRYYNNLRLLDLQLQRVHDHLAATGRLDRTILVFVGDHGQAFGQHPGVWGHNFGFFSETYRAPAIFHQPRLFPARRVDRLTTHADILPTLLDLMGRPWDARRIQGESALRPSRRRFVFFMDGPTHNLGAIDADGNKASISFGLDQVFAYDLRNDPGERTPLPAQRFAAHLDAILKFRNYQVPVMEFYNTALREGKDFDGTRWTEQLLPGAPDSPGK